MSDHLPLPLPRRLNSRRARTGGGQPVTINTVSHSKKLDTALTQALERMPLTRAIEGVDPALIFKIKATGKLQDSALHTNDLQWLGDTIDWTYFVLVSGDEPTKLRQNIREYGDPEGQAPNKTFFDSIDDFLPYDRNDRRGNGLPADDEQFDQPIIVNIVIWPSGDAKSAASRIADTHTVIAKNHISKILVADERPRYTVVRALVDRRTLDDLLDLPVVERIDLQPIPRIEPSTWRNATIDDLPIPRIEQVAPIGIIDDEVMDHPLLPADIIASRSVIPEDHDWQKPSNHGTLVAGLCAYEDFEDYIANESELVACSPIHAVRVLEPHPEDPKRTQFPTDEPVHRVVESAIKLLHDTYGVRIFNLSITDDNAYSGPHVSVWTELLDALARDLDIVIVVAAGNQIPRDLKEKADISHTYPYYLLNDSARIAEPAVAANVVTVGSIAHADAPQTYDGTSRPGDRAIARPNQPSPFTRTGPGAADSVKPDFVERGGNWVLNDTGNLDEENHGVSVISLTGSNQRLFGISNGTSFAAPRVTRMAARILHRYPNASANLIRALLGASATPIDLPKKLSIENHNKYRVGGYGWPHEKRALDSQGSRVAMIYEGEITTDTVAVHAIPIPEAFVSGTSTRTITIALAFDPEVRRTRRDYLAGHMSFDLIRNMTYDEIKDVWSKQPLDKKRKSLPEKRRRPSLTPGSRSTKNNTLQVRKLSRKKLNVDDGDTYHIVVTHTNAAWSPAGKQCYAIVVALEDEERADLDLYALLAARLDVPIRSRARLRG